MICLKFLAFHNRTCLIKCILLMLVSFSFSGLIIEVFIYLDFGKLCTFSEGFLQMYKL